MLSRETMSIQAKRQPVRHINRQDCQLALNMAVTQCMTPEQPLPAPGCVDMYQRPTCRRLSRVWRRLCSEASLPSLWPQCSWAS